MNTKLFIGCVSLNTIHAALEYSQERNISLGLIPSRRQIDYDGGYLGITTLQLKELTLGYEKIVLERDHGGPLQGKSIDDGSLSLVSDSNYFDILHIDPWKKHSCFEDGVKNTLDLISLCLSSGFRGTFEICTEQVIRHFSIEEIYEIASSLSGLPIEYIVIQSGTQLGGNKNIGVYNKEKLVSFIEIAKKFNLKTKEHNGDYLNGNLIKSKFSNGLNAINIAPEFGFIESTCYLEEIGKRKDLLSAFYELCIDCGHWKKWITKDSDISDMTKLIGICGHYVLENPLFLYNIKEKLPDISSKIRQKIKERFSDILC